MIRSKRYLRYCFLLITIMISANSITAQVIPTTQINPSAPAAVNTAPGAYGGSSKINFVRTWDASVPQADPLEVISTSRTVQEVKRNSQYFDGLGRPLQAVSWKASPAGYDMVSPSLYDEYSREIYKYLPFTSTTSDGSFKSNAFTEQGNFYKGLYDQDNYGEKVYYSKFNYESSPAARVLKTMAPGNSWAGNGRGITQSVEANVANEVINWSISTTSGSVPTSSGFYSAGSIVKSMTVDEDGKRVISYKDKDGKLILKKVDNGGTDLVTHQNWICTYYIYDQLTNLRFVLQPRAVEWLRNNSWTFDASTVSSSNLAKEFCFVYEYDSRNRMISKRVPGADEVMLVYNKRDQLVMSQDGNLRINNQWLVTQYDELNRLVRTGIITNASSRATLQTNANADINYPTLNASDIYTDTYYDDYSWVPGGVTGISASLDQTYISSANFILTYNASPYYAQPLTASTVTKGFATGMKTRIIGTSNYLYTVNFYDEYGRVIQSRSTNITTGGYESQTNQYDFEGKLLRSHLYHSYTSGTSQTYQILTKMDYDATGRLLTLKKAMNGGADKTIATYEYDELGRMKKKNLGIKPGTSSTPLEVQDMSYNIRGWVNGINKKFANAEAGVENYFGMTLDYDFGFSQNQYNGNIAGSKWRTMGDWDQRAYGFSYDQSNRLKKADFTQNSSTGWNTSAGINYNLENINYDLNGNITQLKQWGLKGITSTVIDELDYKYLNSDFSNKLLSVKELVVGNQDNKLGDFTDKNTSLDDYTYDNNGNLTVDKNKNITSITYNYLNLPQVITTNKGTITYTYDAAGRKLKKEVNETGVGIKTTNYVGGFVYENNLLQLIAQEEGRIRFNTASSTFVYDYFLKDHLGNVRMVLTEEEQLNQYPTLSFEGTSGTQQVTDQNTFWENSSGQSINVTTTRVSRPGAFGDATANGSYVQLLRKSTGSVGATKLVKVMSGDRLHLKVDYYHNVSSPNNTGANGLSSMISSLLGALTNSPATGALIKDQASSVTSGLNASTDVTNFFSAESGAGGTAPKAYLHVLLFDERFKFDNVNSYVAQVSGSPGKNTFDKFGANAVNVKKNGYAYIYISNESDELVYFDNLMFTHERGRILEETHYYPFGLTMNGISSKSAGTILNLYKYNGIELFNDFEINYSCALYRTLDFQIGRFIQIDPLVSYNESSYVSMGNNPILNKDWLGDYFDFNGNKSAEELYNRLRSENGKKIMEYLTQLSKAPLTSTNKEVQKEIAVIENLVDRHIAFGNEIRTLEESPIKVSVTVNSSMRAGEAGETSYSWTTKSINVALSSTSSNSLNSIAHEFHHAYQYLSGDLAMSKTTSGLLSDMMDEVSAYQTGYLFTSRARGVAEGQYGVDWFKNKLLTDRNWRGAYGNLLGKENSIGINTIAYSVMSFLNGEQKGLVERNKNNANYTMLNLMQDINSIYSLGNGHPPFNITPFNQK